MRNEAVGDLTVGDSSLRHWQMRNEAVGDLTVGDDTVLLPDDFLQADDFWLTGFYKQRLMRGDQRLVVQRYSYDQSEARTRDIPRWYYVSGMRLRFDNPPDKPYHYLLTYYARPEELSDMNQQNFITQTAPRLLRTACMLIACEFEKESGQGSFDRTYWQEQLMGQIHDFQVMSDQTSAPRDHYPEFA